MELKFTSYAWEDYKYWEKQDSRTLKKINALIDSLLREPGASGIGKSERLSGNLSGWCSKRIDTRNRMGYRFEGVSVLCIDFTTESRKNPLPRPAGLIWCGMMRDFYAAY